MSLAGQWDSKILKCSTIYRYVLMTTNQPDTKSNHNPNTTTKQHAVVSTQLNIAT